MKRLLLVLLVAPPMPSWADETPLAGQVQGFIGNQYPSHEDWSIHAQATEIIQGYPAFSAKYNGPDSLSPDEQWKNSTTATLFLGRRLWQGGEFYFDPEMYEGKGLSSSVGVAGFPNSEASKAGGYDFEYGNARVFVRQVFGLGGEKEKVESSQNQLAGDYDISRITLTVGKFAASDIFDNNAYSHDPRNQFINLAIQESAAWDYAANSRGYTQGAAIELNQKKWALRYGIFREPETPNANDLAFHGVNNLAQVAELEERYTLYSNPGRTHFLVFYNRNRGAEFSDAFNLGGNINTAIINSREYGHSKYGFAISAEQQLNDTLGAFARLSWADGHTEDFMFTQVDESAVVGLNQNGKIWNRPQDTAGIAGVINGIFSDQRRALEAGYTGLYIGDGQLNYMPEMILEAYYSYALNTYAFLTPDYQFVAHPAYNADRGPVSIFALRLHLEF